MLVIFHQRRNHPLPEEEIYKILQLSPVEKQTKAHRVCSRNSRKGQLLHTEKDRACGDGLEVKAE